jgi:hypothetical protein
MVVSLAQKLSSMVSSPVGFTQAQQNMALANIGAISYNLVNGKVVEGHAGNLATFSIKTLAGNDPSATEPVYCMFPDATTLMLTAPLSLTTPGTYGPSGISIANRPFRLWFVLINDAGTARIGLFVSHSSDLTKFFTFDGRGITNVVLMTGAQGGQVASSVAGNNKPYRVIAFADYESGLPTASTWTVSPTRIMLVGPNTSLPGTVVQEMNFMTSAQLLCQTGAWSATPLYLTITPTSKINLTKVIADWDTLLVCGASNEQCYSQIWRNDSVNIGPVGAGYGVNGWAATVIQSPTQGVTLWDAPFVNTSTSYRLYIRISVNGGNSFYGPWNDGQMIIQEIMA